VCAAVVKADGYGLGLAEVGTVLHAAGCTKFFVATIDEGIALRKTIGTGPTVYILDGMMAGDTAGEFASHALTPVLNSPGDIALWGAHCRLVDSANAILALDTGMHRLGLTPAEAKDLAAAPDRLDGITLDT
jgi:alanine racemase